jgi:hypothetical protein
VALGEVVLSLQRPGARGPGWNSSLTDGQLVFPAGTQCIVGKDGSSQSSISQLEALTGDRQLAYTAVFARTIESRLAHVTRAQVLAAERGLIVNRFGGSRSAYTAALAGATSRSPSRGRSSADELRRELLERHTHVPAATTSQVQNFYESYPTCSCGR